MRPIRLGARSLITASALACGAAVYTGRMARNPDSFTFDTPDSVFVEPGISPTEAVGFVAVEHRLVKSGIVRPLRGARGAAERGRIEG